ncbi:MAG: hypothetical protein RQ968_02400 [Thermoproteota archaeon]|jgi:Ni,Fe-hydrogenase I large subunit|nr:hypothetical protein [Thermoproteota archaeon]MDT7886208.1 hypothetical protein [Thermoproteota archaeon]
MKRNFEENLLFHNTIDVWIKICEDNNVNWNDVNLYLSFIEFLKKNNIKLMPFNLCIKETGGMYKRGKEKAEFLDKLQKIRKSNVVFIVKFDEELINKINEFIKTLK